MSDKLVLESRIKIPYFWAAGEVGSRFLIELRDNKRIMATRCPNCRKVYCPPKKNCGLCFKFCAEWLEVGPEGQLLGFTQALYASPAHPAKEPIYGLIKLKGADTAMAHCLAGVSLRELRAGMTVVPVFAEKRKGHILDIRYFTIVGGEERLEHG